MPAPETIPVVVRGFDWTAAGTWTLVLTILGTLAGTWLKQRVPSRKVQVEADASLRADLMKLLNEQHASHTAEVAQLKAEQAAERLRCAEDMAQLRREAHEDRARLEGEIKALRDQLLQLHQSTGGVISLSSFKAPEAAKASRRVQRIVAQRRQAKDKP